MQLARELGYIGALLLGKELPGEQDVDALVLAHVRAPEALVMGVGPNQAIAGKEWDEARAHAEGREAQPVPDYRPPRSEGIHGQVEVWFERLVQTRYAYPWGGPRVLPLQALLRRDLREHGESTHIELLALAAHAGIPTVEVELGSEPTRSVPTCRKAAARLLSRFVPLTVRAGVVERLGLGGGYAPPTSSPLSLLLAASLAIGLVLGLSGCPKPVAPAVAQTGCTEEFPVTEWPGAGDPAVAYQELRSDRASLATLWVEQGVVVTDPSFEGERRLRGILARDSEHRLRLRFLGPLGVTVLDYVQSTGRWQLTVPSARLSLSGLVGESLPASTGADVPALSPHRMARLFLSLEDAESLDWKLDSCAILEARDVEGDVVRRFSYRYADGSWEVAREELFGESGLELVANFQDYRSVGDSTTWPYHQELTEPERGTHLTLETRTLRTDELPPSFFAFPTGSF